MLLFPAGFVLNAVYSESTFLFFSVAAIYAVRRHRWGWGLLFGMLSCVTRLVGLAIWPFILLEWLQMHGWTPGRLGQRQAWWNLLQGLRTDWLVPLTSSLVALGLVTYMAYMGDSFGNPFAYFTAQAAWGRVPDAPFRNALYSIRLIRLVDIPGGQLDFLAIANLMALAAGLILSLMVWRRLGAAYGVYSLLLLLIPASTALELMTRYLLVTFPVFIELGALGKHPWLDRALLAGFAVFSGIFMTAFINGHFIA